MRLYVLIQDQRLNIDPDKGELYSWIFLLFVGRRSRAFKMCFQTARHDARWFRSVGVESCNPRNGINRTLVLARWLGTMRN